MGSLVPSVDIPEIGSPGLIWDADNWDAEDWGGAAYEHTLNEQDIVAVSIARGRRSVFDTIPAATAMVMLNNEDAQFVAADIPLGQSIRIIGNRSGGGQDDVFEGTVKTVREIIDNLTQRNALQITAVDGLRELQDYRLVGQDEQLSTDTVKERIDLVLNIVGSQFGRNIQGAGNVMPASTLEGPALGLIEEAAAADGGVFYMRADGIFEYLSESTLYTASRYASPVATISDAVASTLPPVNLATDWSVDRVTNEYTVKIPSGGAFTRENGASVTLHCRRSKSVNIELVSNAEAGALAQLLADLGAAQIEQLEPVVVHGSRGNWDQTLAGIDLFDPVDVTRSAVTTSYIVQGIKHTWRPSPGWTTTFNLDSSIPAEAT